jgi:hypothetical protein
MAKRRQTRYTAKLVPKTLKATRNVGRYATGQIDYFLKKIVKTLKNATHRLDKSSAKVIHSLTRRKLRKYI